jgi:hypothetical protein
MDYHKDQGSYHLSHPQGVYTLFTCQSHSIRFIVLCFLSCLLCVKLIIHCIHCLQRAKRSSRRNLGQRSFGLETLKYPTKKQSLSDDEKLRVNSNDSDTRRPLPETCNSFKPRRDNAQKHGSEDGGCFNAGLCLLVICLLLLLLFFNF